MADRAYLVLADGTVFTGQAIGAPVDGIGEVAAINKTIIAAVG